MKKPHLAVWAMALISNMAGTAQTTTQKILSALYEDWNNSTNSWITSSQYLYTYDNNFYLTAYKRQSFTTSWHDVDKTDITNDAAGNDLQSTTQNWMIAAATWSNSSRTTNTYTLTNQVASTTNENWNGTAWQNAQRYTYGYDNNGYVISNTYQTWNNTAWNDIVRTTVTNDATGNAIQAINQMWASAASTWSNTSRTTNAYTLSNKLTSTTYENWTANGWENVNRYVYTYDNNGYAATSLYQNWAGSAWKDVFTSTITNNTYGNPTQILNQSWPGNPPTLTNSTRVTNTYSTVTTSGTTGIIQYANTPALKLYPVPATDAVQLEFNGQPCAYSIYDEAGNKISTATMAIGINSIDITTLAKGAYFLRTEQGQSIKLIKH